jgi:hypothetical protein
MHIATSHHYPELNPAALFLILATECVTPQSPNPGVVKSVRVASRDEYGRIERVVTDLARLGFTAQATSAFKYEGAHRIDAQHSVFIHAPITRAVIASVPIHSVQHITAALRGGSMVHSEFTVNSTAAAIAANIPIVGASLQNIIRAELAALQRAHIRRFCPVGPQHHPSAPPDSL